MEIGPASEVLTMLASAFPRRWRNAPAEETQLWAEFLMSMDYDPAREVAGDFIRTVAEMPSIAEFRIAYLKLAKGDMAGEATRQIETVYENEPHTPEAWEQMARKHREWRAAEYPDTDDPAQTAPLPRSRAEFGLEWTTWFKARFGWGPVVA